MTIVFQESSLVALKYSGKSENNPDYIRWGSVADKAAFIRQFVLFVENDYPLRLFEPLYKQLSMGLFGHYAHYDLAGFYKEFFLCGLAGKKNFIWQCHNWHAQGNPEYVNSDVEAILIEWLKENRILYDLENKMELVSNQHDRNEYERLKKKFQEYTITAEELELISNELISNNVPDPKWYIDLGMMVERLRKSL